MFEDLLNIFFKDKAKVQPDSRDVQVAGAQAGGGTVWRAGAGWGHPAPRRVYRRYSSSHGPSLAAPRGARIWGGQGSGARVNASEVKAKRKDRLR